MLSNYENHNIILLLFKKTHSPTIKEKREHTKNIANSHPTSSNLQKNIINFSYFDKYKHFFLKIERPFSHVISELFPK